MTKHTFVLHQVNIWGYRKVGVVNLSYFKIYRSQVRKLQMIFITCLSKVFMLSIFYESNVNTLLEVIKRLGLVQ